MLAKIQSEPLIPPSTLQRPVPRFMTTVIESIKALGPNEKFCLLEFFPPKTETGFRNLLARLHRMMALNPLFITVTWGAGGSTSQKSLDLAATCQKELGITTVLHLTCTNTNKEVIDDALERAKIAGIRNILALRGDPPRTREYWTPNCDLSNAVDLVKYIKERYGDYFCVGVAGYPEGHTDSTSETQQNPRKDLPFLIEKVKAGADFIITQLFFDVDKFVAYEKMLRSVPELANTVLIPGLMPITTHKVFLRSTKLSNARVPRDISKRLEAPGNDDNMVKSIGIDILTDMIAQIDSKTESRIKGYHFYTLNLEKSVAYIVENSKLFRQQLPEPAVDHEDAVASDSDGDEMAVKAAQETYLNRKNQIIKDTRIASISRALRNDRKAIVDISTGKGALGKDATWDEFTNGRFGDSNSPAYGEIDGYGPNLKLHSTEKVLETWGSPTSEQEISQLFKDYLSGKIDVLPWADQGVSTETALIQEELFEVNDKGWFTLASQPAVNACESSDKLFGWGPSHGYLFQKGFVEFFIPKVEWDTKLSVRLKPLIEEKSITFYRGDSKGHIDSNLRIGENQNSKTAVTWGVFPSKEILQPTIIDYESFKAWNDEAFLLWIEWARCYKRDSVSHKLLNSINEDYYLISMIHHDFTDEHALWNTLLEN